MKKTIRSAHESTNSKTGEKHAVREHLMKIPDAKKLNSSTEKKRGPKLDGVTDMGIVEAQLYVGDNAEQATPPERGTYLSPSSAATWNQCPRRWWYRYVEKIPEPPAGEPAVVGNYVHEVLENLMEREPEGRTRDEAHRLAEEIFGSFREDDKYLSLGYDEAQTEKFLARSHAIIDAYFSFIDPKSVDPVGQEVQVQTEIDGVPFMGFVDLVERDPNTGEIVVTDYKTGKPPSFGKPWSNDERAEKMLQPMWYAAALKEMGVHDPVRARLVYFTVEDDGAGGYSPVTEEISMTVDDESVRVAREELTSRWADIQDARETGETEARPGPLCGWCPFVDRCGEGRAEVERRWNDQNPKTGYRRLRKDAPAVSILGLA